MVDGKIDEDTEIIFEYNDYIADTYDNSWTYTFKVKEIMPYIQRDLEERLRLEEENNTPSP